MSSTGLKWTALMFVAAGGVGAFAMYTVARHGSDTGSDAQTDGQAIDAVRARAEQACEAPWWEDDYCASRVKTTTFTVQGRPIEGLWLVREHVRGDRPFQDTCWVVEPERLSRRASEWPSAGLSPARCECPLPDELRLPVVLPDGRKLDPEVGRIIVAQCRDHAD